MRRSPSLANQVPLHPLLGPSLAALSVLLVGCASLPGEPVERPEDLRDLKDFLHSSERSCRQAEELVVSGQARSSRGQVPFEGLSRENRFALDLLSPLGSSLVTIELATRGSESSGSCRGQCPPIWKALAAKSSATEIRALLCAQPGAVPSALGDPSEWHVDQGQFHWRGKARLGGQKARVRLTLERRPCPQKGPEARSEKTESSDPPDSQGFRLTAHWDFGWFSKTSLETEWTGCTRDGVFELQRFQSFLPEGESLFLFELFETRGAPLSRSSSEASVIYGARSAAPPFSPEDGVLGSVGRKSH